MLEREGRCQRIHCWIMIIHNIITYCCISIIIVYIFDTLQFFFAIIIYSYILSFYVANSKWLITVRPTVLILICLFISSRQL